MNQNEAYQTTDDESHFSLHSAGLLGSKERCKGGDDMNDDNTTDGSTHDTEGASANNAADVPASVTKKARDAAAALASESSRIASETASAAKNAAAIIGNKASQVASDAAILVGDLNGDGVVDEEDLKIARGYAAGALSSAASGLTVAGQEAGNLAKSVARAPLAKDVATYAAVGAVIAIPIPFVGSALGAAVGAGLGLLRNFKRNEPASVEAPKDAVAELERLHSLKEKGILTEEEFLNQKRKLLR